MFVVIADDYDPHNNSIWGPFKTEAAASKWIDANWQHVNAKPTPGWLIEQLEMYVMEDTNV